MLKKNMQVSEKTKVLDLACGKGAVSVQVAKELGCMVILNNDDEYYISNLAVFEEFRGRGFGVEFIELM